MTLDEIKSSDKTILVPKDVGEILNADPYNINIQAQNQPAKLGFPVTVIGNRVKIPRKPFIQFMEAYQGQMFYPLFRDIEEIRDRLELTENLIPTLALLEEMLDQMRMMMGVVHNSER